MQNARTVHRPGILDTAVRADLPGQTFGLPEDLGQCLVDCTGDLVDVIGSGDQRRA
jgi:hypothetical protein